ncbi:MAG: bifunctional ornithine acetyltransferase/N-acetylglutamate synthase [Actinobacteria bacterium]|nr:bifunctional ornithine acetyltransferase/N-acetylglutamate synthase [Actinomycetota bacterium]
MRAVVRAPSPSRRSPSASADSRARRTPAEESRARTATPTQFCARDRGRGALRYVGSVGHAFKATQVRRRRVRHSDDRRTSHPATNARELVSAVAARIGCNDSELVVASTGVIGRQYPMDRVRSGIAALPTQLTGTDASLVARAIMTTDTRPKIAEATVRGSSARVVGVAKGVGMIEPDMATHISLIFTDAAISRGELDVVFRRTVGRTFNRVSIDTDTSTSDTTVCLASGAAGTVDSSAFAAALHDVLLSLTKQIARDGEGAERIIEVCVDSARDEEQAVTVARAIVNSPLVKTAVHGADPNWGRVAMAVGKCAQYTDISQERVVIRFGEQEVFPTQVDEAGLTRLSTYMRSEEVLIHVSLNTGDAEATVWGCDLSAGYVRINADYTT